jgi:hypothetical protein
MIRVEDFEQTNEDAFREIPRGCRSHGAEQSRTARALLDGDSIGFSKYGRSANVLHELISKSEVDSGGQSGTTTEMGDRLTALECENWDLGSRDFRRLKRESSP